MTIPLLIHSSHLIVPISIKNVISFGFLNPFISFLLPITLIAVCSLISNTYINSSKEAVLILIICLAKDFSIAPVTSGEASDYVKTINENFFIL